MAKNQSMNLQPPRGLLRWFNRLPIFFYKVGIGWLLGKRFLLLSHTGRKSGLPRQTVLEVVRYDSQKRIFIVASGWGERSDWLRNVINHPAVHIASGVHRFEAVAARLQPEAAQAELLDYARRHPVALKGLSRIMDYQLDGSEESIRALGRVLPLVAFQAVLEQAD
ncbi:MAG: nitroreductase family deazaflavin-dependent oxidoreductase [Anaerolineae bacterium]|nr:nitroreductase family deazaflavin-dependent oxidoreductase [Anaerolineae bacterium]